MLALPLRLSVLLLALATLAPAAAAGPPSPFTGAWQATDPDDGSTLTLHYAASGRITIIDQAAGACEGRPARAAGTATEADGTLSATVDVSCNGGDVLAEDAEFDFVRNGATLEGLGVVWTRPGRGP